MPVVRRFLTALTAGALLVAGSLATASTASAHDQLLSSSPADGEVVTTAPAALTLEFSADVLDLSTAVVLTLPDGSVREDLAVTVAGPIVTAALPGDLVSGAYAVAWRVVSADGHPIEGTFAYTVDDPTRPVGGATPTPTPLASETATAAATPEVEAPAQTPSATATLTARSSSTEPDDSPSLWPLLGLVVAAAASVGVLLVRRHRRQDR
ncbi:copper resistance CopC family protein [Cellulomonas soli]